MDPPRAQATDRPPSHRPCVKCGRVLAETRDNFYFRGDSGRYREECKVCFRSAKNARYQADPIKHRDIARRSYHQLEGDVTKGVATKHRNRRADPARYRAILLRYEESHSVERKSDRVRRHAANREANNAESQAWYYANLKRALATTRAWQKANPERARYHVENARMRRMAAYSTLTEAEWRGDSRDSYKGLCAYCDAPAQEMEHVIPLGKGGDHTAENVVPACWSCNRHKAGKWPGDWLREDATRVRNSKHD